MSSYLVNMEIAQVYGFQYAIPVGIVLLCALLVFLFGFKTVEEPDFIKLSHGLSDERKSKKKKKEKDRLKNQPNGSVEVSKSSSSTSTRDDKKSVVPKEEKLGVSKDKKGEVRHDKTVLKENKKSVKQENKENIKSKQEKEVKKEKSQVTVKAKTEKNSKDAKKLQSAKDEKIIPLSSKENKKANADEKPRTDQKVPAVKSAISNVQNTSAKSTESVKPTEKGSKKKVGTPAQITQPSDDKKNTLKHVKASTSSSNNDKPYSEKNKENVNKGDWVEVGKKKKKDTALIEKAPAGKASPAKKAAESTKSQDHVTKLDHVLQLVKNLEAEGIEIKCPEFEKEVEVFLSAQKKSTSAEVQAETQVKKDANRESDAVDPAGDKAKSKKKNKKYQEAAAMGGESAAPNTSDLQIQELPTRDTEKAQKEVPKSSKVKSPGADHSTPVTESEVKNVSTSNKENIAFDELGDTWQETKVQKKRKKLRRDQ